MKSPQGMVHSIGIVSPSLRGILIAFYPYNIKEQLYTPKNSTISTANLFLASLKTRLIVFNIIFEFNVYLFLLIND